MADSKKTAKGDSSTTNKMQAKYDAIWALLDPFCLERLDDEYQQLCLRMLNVLMRKRPSPLVNGTAAGWACGIARAIGCVNFLDDPTQSPHMKMSELDKAFGVSIATGQGKSKAIRDLLNIDLMDPHWTRPSMMDDNLMAWMVQLNNGMIVDVRSLPREVQVDAFERDVIPYVHADRGNQAP